METAQFVIIIICQNDVINIYGLIYKCKCFIKKDLKKIYQLKISLVNQAFLLKKQGEWEQIHLANLEMINAANAKGLKVCLKELGVEK